MGNKAAYAEVILDALGLRSGQGAGAYLWAEADPDVRALLRAYPDAAMLTRIAEIIRGWADEEPRALWERLRAERKARGPAVEPADVGGWMVGGWLSYAQDPERGFRATAGGTWPDDPPDPQTIGNRCTSLAAYATIAASNRLINVAGPELMNTGNGGTRFGGDFATPAGDVAAGFERVAGWSTLAAWTKGNDADASLYMGPDRPSACHEPGWVASITAAGLAGRYERAPSRWPPVAVLPTIPSAADVAAWLGTPGDLDGVVVYMDPDYRATTGYGSTCREMIPGLAIDYDALGAVVCISEQEPLPEIPTWYATEITGGRKGQKRTFSKQKREWLTMNRPPAATVAEQVGLFG